MGPTITNKFLEISFKKKDSPNVYTSNSAIDL